MSRLVEGLSASQEGRFLIHGGSYNIWYMKKNLWLTKWHSEKFFHSYFTFPLSVSFHQCHDVCCAILPTDRVIQQNMSCPTHQHQTE